MPFESYSPVHKKTLKNGNTVAFRTEHALYIIIHHLVQAWHHRI